MQSCSLAVFQDAEQQIMILEERLQRLMLVDSECVRLYNNPSSLVISTINTLCQLNSTVCFSDVVERRRLGQSHSDLRD